MDTALLAHVEQKCIELENNIAKVRKALQHWQTWELDYEGLKDEFLGLGETATKQECLNVAREFAPHKVDEKELIELVEPSKGKMRRPSQVVEVLEKRVDYVLKNIDTLRKQLADLEKQRNKLLLVRNGELDQDDGAGLPVSEITEELDDDGNVLSYNVQTQGETAPKVLDLLEKTKVETKHDTSEETLAEVTKDEPSIPSIPLETKASEPTKPSQPSDDESDVESIEHSTPSNLPTNPEDTEEEAELRREMLLYGLGEVGNIVAELELAENGKFSDVDEEIDDVSDLDVDEEDFADSYSDDDDDDDESEDETGRVKGSMHSAKYRQQMEALQKKLGIAMENVGPTPDLPAEVKKHIEHPPSEQARDYIGHLPPDLRKRVQKPHPAEAARKAAIARAETASKSLSEAPSTSKPTTKSKSKKSVAFAEELDIAPEIASASPRKVIKEDVLERSAPFTTSPSAPSQPSKPPSRFKAARSQPSLLPPPISTHSQPPASPGPPNKITSDTLIERPSPVKASAAQPPDGDDFDEGLQKRQMALEHHNLRNRAIHDQGGYVGGGELENWGEEYVAPEVLDERTGLPKKISRFKAARMR